MLKIPKEAILIKNKDFQTIIIRVMFPFFNDDKDLIKNILVPRMIVYMNSKYPSEDSLTIAKKKNYILRATCSEMAIGNNSFLCFDLLIPDTNSLGFDNLEEQIKLFSEIIYEPKIIDEGFDPREVRRECDNLLLSVSNGLKNLKYYQGYKTAKAVDDYGIMSRSVVDHIGDIQDINPQNLYETYKKLISEYNPIIGVFGNFNSKRINSLINKYLRKYKGKDEFKNELNCFLKPRSKVQVIDDGGNFKDSCISLFYKVDKMVDEDRKYLLLIRSLLTSLSSRLLQKKLRDQFDLVYSNSVISYGRYGVLELTAYINKNNKDITKEKMLEVIESLKNPDEIREALDNLKELRRIALIKCLDDKATLMIDKMYEVLGIDKNMYEDYEEILKVSAEDISKFANRLVLDTIYYIEEESHE